MKQFTKFSSVSASSVINPYHNNSYEPVYVYSITPLCVASHYLSRIFRKEHLENEKTLEIVSEVVWDVVDVSWETIYHKWVQREIFPYAVEDAKKKLLQAVSVSRGNLCTVLCTNIEMFINKW